jgi:septal ring factor EnvC (AmiA/AmiB activator)
MNESNANLTIESLLNRLDLLEGENALLRSEVEQLKAENLQLRSEILALKTENEQLNLELAATRKDSSNSSKPPSSDIVKPPKPHKSKGKRHAIYFVNAGTLRYWRTTWS